MRSTQQTRPQGSQQLPPTCLTEQTWRPRVISTERADLAPASCSSRNHIEAMRLLAQIGMSSTSWTMRNFSSKDVLVFAPTIMPLATTTPGARTRHKYTRAKEEAQKLLTIDPVKSGFSYRICKCQRGLGSHQTALSTFRELSAEDSGNRTCICRWATRLKRLAGNRKQSIPIARRASAGELRRCLLEPRKFKTYRFRDIEITSMREQSARSTSDA